MTSIRFPNESRNYRRARQALLEAELELRAQIERVNQQRRRLPMGGEIPQDSWPNRMCTPLGVTLPVGAGRTSASFPVA